MNRTRLITSLASCSSVTPTDLDSGILSEREMDGLTRLSSNPFYAYYARLSIELGRKHNVEPSWRRFSKTLIWESKTCTEPLGENFA